jgi:hypothetical protein
MPIVDSKGLFAFRRAATFARRTLLGAALASGLADLLRRIAGVDATAKKKRRRKKVKRNDFGCVNVGGLCRNSGQCCSGICQGKKDKKRCQAHDASTCQADQDICNDAKAGCVTTAAAQGVCARTTGNASYCEADIVCFPCAKDADCQPICGAAAACICCAGCPDEGGTACVGVTSDSCIEP